MRDYIKEQLHSILLFCGIIVIIAMLSLAGLSLSGKKSTFNCPACGNEGVEPTKCPVCGMEVCESCASDEYFLEDYYNSGKMQEYMEREGCIVLDDPQSAFELYAYGFYSGYEKAHKGNVYDKETQEILSYDYDYLTERYGEYEW